MKWLRRKGADIHGVARAGLAAGLSYGAEGIGLRPAAREARRRLFGEASVLNPGGASLSAKLAVAGAGFKEWDPFGLGSCPCVQGAASSYLARSGQKDESVSYLGKND